MSAAKLHDEPVHAVHLSGAKADLHRLLVALVKLALVGDAPEAAAWRADALDVQKRVAADPVGHAGLPMDSLWALAIKTAEKDPLVRRDETVNPMLPTMSPLRPEHLAATPFELEDAVQIIRDVASFG